jgi:hypothetical protein
MTEIKEGTDWTAWGSFDAYDVGDHQRFPVQIKPSQKFTLTVIRTTDDPNKVYFSYGTGVLTPRSTAGHGEVSF